MCCPFVSFHNARLDDLELFNGLILSEFLFKHVRDLVVDYPE